MTHEKKYYHVFEQDNFEIYKGDEHIATFYTPEIMKIDQTEKDVKMIVEILNKKAK